MTSPFPGMDPYLERFWGDVHHALITYARDVIQQRLPDDLRARMQERVFVEEPGPTEQHYYPDISIIERPTRRPAEPEGGVAVATVAEPLVIDVPEAETIREGYIEIIDVRSGRKVITTIEVLSPANKRPGEGQDLYLKKQADMRRAGVSMVEIDLLRGGKRVLMVRQERIRPPWRTAYQICVWRAFRPLVAEIYRAALRERLPVIPVPLRPTDAEVTLDLQDLIRQCYRNGGYDDIDYQAEPDPPLELEDAAWADAWLKERGKR